MAKSIGLGFYDDSAFAEVTTVLGAVSDAASGPRPVPVRCACHRARFVVERHLRCTSMEESDRYVVKEDHRRLLNLAARFHGWRSLRGWAGRRKTVEKLVLQPAHPGRPRKVFFAASDLEWAKDFLDHVRVVTQQHIDECTFEVVWSVEVSPEKGPRKIEGALVSEFIHRAGDVIEEARRLSPGMYRRRRKRLAARLLAQMVGCSPESVRGPLPERSPRGLQKAADALRSYLRALRYVPDIELNSSNEAREVVVDPGAVRGLAKDPEAARKLQERADRAGKARRWSRDQ